MCEKRATINPCLRFPPPPHPFSLQRFNPKFANAEMRSRLSDGHPDDPLIIYVGRLGAEKRLRDLKGVLERWDRDREGGREGAAALWRLPEDACSVDTSCYCT